MNENNTHNQIQHTALTTNHTNTNINGEKVVGNGGVDDYFNNMGQDTLNSFIYEEGDEDGTHNINGKSFSQGINTGR